MKKLKKGFFCQLSTINYELLLVVVYQLSTMNCQLFASGTTSAEFLKIGIGARAIAMGEAFVGVANDVNTIYWNPAGLGLLKKQEATFMYNEGFMGIKSGFIGYAYPAESGSASVPSGKEIGTFGGSITYLNTGTIVGRNNIGQKTADFTGIDMAVCLGYSREIIERMWIGVGIKYISEIIESIQGTGFAIDISGLIQPFKEEEFKLGFNLQNIGTTMRFVSEDTPLPFNIKVGAGYTLFNRSLTIALDVNKPVKDPMYVNLGAEYWFKGLIALRAGYTFDSKYERKVGITGGIGIKYQGYQIDYAFMPFDDLGSTHRISLLVKF